MPAKPSRPALPFRPFHPEALTDEEIRGELAMREDCRGMRAVMQLIEGEMFDAIHGMASGDVRAQGEFAGLHGIYTKLEGLIRGRVERPVR